MPQNLITNFFPRMVRTQGTVPGTSQALITNYFPVAQPLTNTVIPDNQAYSRGAYLTHELEYVEVAEEFQARSINNCIPGPIHGAYGTLSLYVDENLDRWINHIQVAGFARRLGIGNKLVQKAIETHGHIYASNSPIDPGGAGDTRHLSMEGAALVNALIHAGIMQQGWLRAPVI